MSTTPQQPDLETFDRMPPANKDAERAVLGSILLAPKMLLDVEKILAERDFYVPAHQRTYRAILELRRDGQPVDHMLLIQALEGSPDFADKGEIAVFITEIAQSVPTAANAGHYAGLVKEASDKRRVQHLFGDFYQAALNGQPVEELLADAQHDLGELGRVTGSREPLFPIITSVELDTGEYRTVYVIDGVLVAGQPCILAGAKKDLKTTIAIDLVISIAVGGFFLGKFRVNQSRRVLMMTGESGLPTIQETARRIARTAGHNLGDIGDLIWSDKLPRFGDTVHLDEFEQLIQAEGLEVVVVDPTYLAMPGADAGNLFIQGDLLRGITEVCGRHNVTLILIHHTRKGGKVDPFAPPELEHIAWAGFQEWARQWILIGRRERYEPGTGLHRLWLNCGGSAGHSSLRGLDVDEGVYSPDTERWWNVTVINAEEVRGAAENRIEAAKETQRGEQLDRDKAAVLEAVLKCPDRKGTKTDIRNRFGRNVQAFNLAFTDLFNSGDIVTVENVKIVNGRSWDGFTIRDEKTNE